MSEKSSKPITLFIITLIVFLITAQIGTSAIDNSGVTKREYWPTKAWKASNPQKLGMDPAKLLDMDNFIRSKLKHIRSVLIVKGGYLVFEKYYNKHTNQEQFVIASDTKTVTSVLIGIAIKKGYIKSVKQKIVDFFPEFVTNKIDKKLKEITIENLLTMTSGIYWDENFVYRPEVHDNAIKYAFGQKVVTEPGEVFNYSTMDSQILSGIITKTTKMSELAFAKKYLFKPLGIKEGKWEADAQGYNLGGMELYLRTQDMARFGYLLLNKGSWEGQQIIPSDWVANMTRKHNSGGAPHGVDYGYHCWVTTVLGYHAYFAGGFGGQFIYEIPALDIVVAISSDIDIHHEENRDIISKYIIPAIKK